MNIVRTGTCFRIFDDSVKTMDKLPVDQYELNCDRSGIFLTKIGDMKAVPDVVYGDFRKRLDKVEKAYRGCKDNMGVILSGPKGMGKTMFARAIAERMLGHKVPVVYVNHMFSGIPEFIASILQDCVVIFDEFDKSFYSNSEDSCDKAAVQNGLLSMFDGIYKGHKLFVITCNDLYKVSDYYINRPGRFRYHIRFDHPNKDTVEKYMLDRLGKKKAKEVKKIVEFSSFVNLSYDSLDALATEMSDGTTFKEALEILNIVQEHSEDRRRYNVSAVFTVDRTQVKAKIHECVRFSEFPSPNDEDDCRNMHSTLEVAVNGVYRTYGRINYCVSSLSELKREGDAFIVPKELISFEPDRSQRGKKIVIDHLEITKSASDRYGTSYSLLI